MTPHFLLDENLPYALLDWLHQKGYTVEHLKKIGQTGIRNGDVYRLAETKGCWIVTRDADFQSRYNFVQYNVAGVILFKLSESKTSLIIRAMKRLLKDHHDKLEIRQQTSDHC